MNGENLKEITYKVIMSNNNIKIHYYQKQN